jgi:hypothetical protein
MVMAATPYKQEHVTGNLTNSTLSTVNMHEKSCFWVMNIVTIFTENAKRSAGSVPSLPVPHNYASLLAFLTYSLHLG